MNKLVLWVTALCVAVWSTAASADSLNIGDSFYGGWWISGERAGDMVIGDGQGYGISLGSTNLYCGRPGASYTTMKQYVNSNYPNFVSWYVDDTCTEGYVRICVYAIWGAQACSSYRYFGWVRLN